ncbi:hypothetical protein CMT41_16385 [Colwellia sp. MT41]|uniref:HNH endonuclease n=1 Tax=Colwellia sp. MT41 TaxID=58049 RepID=UPI000717B8A9|nr:HNH endonuclease [Colwellia sp. MT41]ALO36131.1 hypothetical protein CMT41_16385 [Colwellia sp. MT41]
MNDNNRPIRILPMSMSADIFKDKTHNEVQSEFFLSRLPFNQNGQYHFHLNSIQAGSGTTVLFQYRAKIIASAVFEKRVDFDKPNREYNGALYFDINTIKVFDPVGSELIRSIWPEEFNGFSQATTKLNEDFLSVFEEKLTGLKTPLVSTPKAVDVSTPEAVDINSGNETPQASKQHIYRILRDSKLARYIKLVHSNSCQLCSKTITLPNKKLYSEAHHIIPLGKPHNGPDKAENIIVLCPNCHVLCDYGAISLDLSKIKHVADHKISKESIEYHNKKIAGHYL